VGGIDEARAPALLASPYARELEKPSTPADLGEIAILAFVVTEEAQAENLLGHPGELRLCVGGDETGKHEKAGPDAPGNPALRPNLRAFYPLEDYPHSTVTDLARFRGWSTLQPRRTAM
jgi:hypothetical protein